MKQSRSWWLLVIVSLSVMIPFMAPYMTLNPDSSRIEITSRTVQFPALVLHIGFAFVAMVSGFVQFIGVIRQRHPKVHRYMGRVYVASVFISGLLALVVIGYVEDFSKAVSFLALTLLWLITCWKGYRTAVHRRFVDHRIWMIRSFGITLVAVCARLMVPVLFLTYYVLNGLSIPGGKDMMIERVLNVNIWAGLVVELVLVEWLIVSRYREAKKGSVDV